MRKIVAFVVPLLMLAACGNEEEIAAKKQTLSKLRARYKTLNQEIVDQSAEWGKVKQAVIPAQREFKRAKLSGDDDAVAAAKANLDQAQAAANDVIAQEEGLRKQVRDLRTKITNLEDAIKRLGGKP